MSSRLNPSLKKLRNALRRIVPSWFVFGKGLGLLYSKRSFLRTSGYLLSVRLKQPVRPDGSPIPWMNYAAISFLEKRLTPDLVVFEFGSGNSTRFFARLVRRVVSVECDAGWYAKVSAELPTNVQLILCSPYDRDRYLATLTSRPERFDVIIVDAEDREACLRVAPDRLTERGVIVLDDANRPAYQDAIAYLGERGFKELDLEGLKPGGLRAYRTSVFYRPGNAVEI